MNKILLTVLILLFFTSLANAQFSKGSILLGGNFFYSENKNSTNTIGLPEQKYNAANFNISAGKAVTGNAVFGLNLGFITSSTSNYSQYPYGSQIFKSNGYDIGVFYRKYKGMGKDFYLFGEIDATYTFGNQFVKDSTGSKISNGNTYGGNAAFELGISYKVSKKILMEISLPSLFSVTYISNKTTSTGQISKNDQFNINTSLSTSPLDNLAIGFRLIL